MNKKYIFHYIDGNLFSNNSFIDDYRRHNDSNDSDDDIIKKFGFELYSKKTIPKYCTFIIFINKSDDFNIDDGVYLLKFIMHGNDNDDTIFDYYSFDDISSVLTFIKNVYIINDYIDSLSD